MSEPILKALIQLFALISDIHDETVISSKSKDIVRLFLLRHLNSEMVEKYMAMFDEYLMQFHPENIIRGSMKERKRTSLNAMRILAICEKINEELQQSQKIYVIVQLMDFISFSAEITENKIEFLETVSQAFNIPAPEYKNIKSFILDNAYDIHEKNRILIADNTHGSGQKDLKFLTVENLEGRIFFLSVDSTNTILMRYKGDEDLFLNGQNIFPHQTCIFDRGSSIRGIRIKTIYFNDIAGSFSKESFKKVSLDGTDITYRFRNSDNGIQKLSLHEESGKLVGIMGGSGVGKTTLINVLSGITRPQNGTVLINGYDLYSEKDKEQLKGVIGLVPQDDLLIEDLTVYQNLYYNARMCLDNLGDKKLAEVIDKTLIDLELDGIRDLKVGNPLDKVISGGQRKRLNIALELIREPTVMFVDEPTSGLSSVDAETVMNLFKEQACRGKLVIINIHQPSSEIYKMFDKIMVIDKGGYIIFYGNPTEAIVYFKTLALHANPSEDQCIKCGNVNPDQLLQIVEAKVVNEHGKPTHIRKVSPVEWAEKFVNETNEIKQGNLPATKNLPENLYSTPSLLKQSSIFFTRDFLSKLANRQYILISMLGAPLLAFLLSYFTKDVAGPGYIFRENENLPAYMFMCVITSMFMGLIISAEEIVKDRKILKRESFLNLSWFSYINSKIMMMFIISAIQAISFIIVGNSILEIRGMIFAYWMVLFTTSCLANLIGLNISSAFSSIISIYILIPFIVIPQLLFSGVLVPFDKLHRNTQSPTAYVPIICDLMPTRWSFEALAVEQFKNNKYEKNFFELNIQESQNVWYLNRLIPSLKKKVEECKFAGKNPVYRDNSERNLRIIRYHINELSAISGLKSGDWYKDLNYSGFNNYSGNITEMYLDSLSKRFRQLNKDVNAKKNSIKVSITNKKLLYLKDIYDNKKLNEMVLKIETGNDIIETHKRFIKNWEAVYTRPVSKNGRAHFYAPYKQIGNLKIDTYWFNLLVLWTVSILLYIVLYYKLLQKIITDFANFRFKRAGI